MKILEALFKKIENNVDWSTLRNHTGLTSILQDYHNREELSKEYIMDLQGKMQGVMNAHKTFTSSIVSTLKNYVNSDGILIEDMLYQIEEQMNPDNAYISIRSVYMDAKMKFEEFGRVPTEYEKFLLDSLKFYADKLSKNINKPEELWSVYSRINEIMNIDINSLMSEKDPNWNNGIGDNLENNNAPSKSGNTDKVEDPQNKFNWGQGNDKDLLGIKETFNTYSGTDMLATITIPGKEPIVFGELSQLSYSIYREKVPIRTLGRITPKGYTRGLRTISGIMIFSIFDRSIVYECMKELHREGYRILMDEMPTFDVTITMANEFGHWSIMTLYGITTYSEGKMMGVDTLGIQNAYEFYAIDIDPMRRLEDKLMLNGTSVIDTNGNITKNAISSSTQNVNRNQYLYSSNVRPLLHNKFAFSERV